MMRDGIIAREALGMAGGGRGDAEQARVGIALERAGVNDADELRADKADADGIVHFELPPNTASW